MLIKRRGIFIVSNLLVLIFFSIEPLILTLKGSKTTGEVIAAVDTPFRKGRYERTYYKRAVVEYRPVSENNSDQSPIRFTTRPLEKVIIGHNPPVIYLKKFPVFAAVNSPMGIWGDKLINGAFSLMVLNAAILAFVRKQPTKAHTTK